MILAELVRAATSGAAARQEIHSFKQLESSLPQAPETRGFASALSGARGMGLIAELKPASPSAGVIREPFVVEELAHGLVQGGANCLSVLTEAPHFHGSLANLRRADVGVPRLQKDFLVSEYQILEGRLAGADAILLIAEALEPQRARELCRFALSLGMDVLYEAHDAGQIESVVGLAETQPDRILVGINNRNLRTFAVDLHTTIRAMRTMPTHLHVVGESGITSTDDARLLRDAGVGSILVGESLMRQPDVRQAVRALLSRVRPA